MPKTPVSVVILAKNEAGRIADCLRSVAWADEALVVDDDSSDKTVEIASSLGARVVHRKMDLEGRHRNWAYAQARHEWVLSLDADERITPELAREIQDLVAGNPGCDIYAIPRRNFIGRRWIRHGGWYPSPQVKLFRKQLFKWEETTVHPRAVSSSSKPWGSLKQDMIHFSYRDFADFAGKLNRQTTLEAEKWLLDKRKMGLGKALWRTVDRFYRAWSGKKGHRDGFPGYAVAVLGGAYQFLSYAKYWLAKQEAAQLRNDRPRQRKTRFPAWPAAARPATLSVVVLAKNSAPTISRCLESVRWAGELVVVDGGSTDGTAELCRAAGAAVIVEPADDDFARLRNAGIDASHGDWVLQLDSDEVVTPEFRKELEQLLAREVPHAAFKFRRMNNFLGRWMRFGGWDHHSLHLLRRGKARYRGRVHEDMVVQGTVGVLETGVEHYPFRTIEEFMDRQNRYTSLAARQIVESSDSIPMKTIWWYTTARPLKQFWKMAVKKRAILDGRVGLIFSVLYAFVLFLKWVKVWEIAHGASENSGRT